MKKRRIRTTVRVRPDQLELWRDAARRTGLDLESWIIRAADRDAWDAARDTLRQ